MVFSSGNQIDSNKNYIHLSSQFIKLKRTTISKNWFFLCKNSFLTFNTMNNEQTKYLALIRNIKYTYTNI